MSYSMKLFTRILLLLGLAGSIHAQGLTATLTLTHGIRISGPNVTITFRTDCPNETIYCCQLDDGQFQECTSPKTYYNLPLGVHTVSIKAQAVKLGLPLDPAIANRNFTIVTPVVVQPLRVQGSARSLGDSVVAIFSATKPSTFHCKIDNGAFFLCSSPYTFTDLEAGRHRIIIRATATADPTQTARYNIRISVTKSENFRVDGQYSLSTTNKLTLLFSATADATFRCRVIKNLPPPLSTTPWIPCSDGIMYSDLGCGLFTAQIEATSTSSPPTKFTLDLQQIAIPCSSNCTEAETTPLQGTASVTVNAPNAIININLNGPAILSCRLNNGPLSPCYDNFIYRNLSANNYTIEVIATSPCDPRKQIVYKKNITIDAPVDGGWGPWIDLGCTVNERRCGVGVHTRVRGCINPVPQNGGKPCGGDSIVREPCGTPCNVTTPPHVTATAQVFNNCSARLIISANMRATFRCRVNQGPWESCSSGYLAANLQSGVNKIEIEATAIANPRAKSIGSATVDLTGQVCSAVEIRHPVCNPSVVGDNFTFTFEANHPVTQYLCSLDNKRPRPCNEGMVTYSNLRRKTYVVTVTASTAGGETVQKNFTFESKYRNKFCQVYECSNGVVVDGNSATLTFTSDDPGATFKCRLNRKPIRPCISPLELKSLSPATYNLDIAPSCSNQAKGRRQKYTFTIP